MGTRKWQSNSNASLVIFRHDKFSAAEMPKKCSERRFFCTHPSIETASFDNCIFVLSKIILFSRKLLSETNLSFSMVKGYLAAPVGTFTKEILNTEQPGRDHEQ